MRAAALACLMLAACVTGGSARTPDDLVRGCWINRDAGATTMRWLPNPQRPGVLAGHKLIYRQAGPPEATRFSLEPSEEGWSLCELDAQGGAAVSCWQVAQGEGGSLEGGRVFIDAHGDRLRITIIGDGAERILFQGRRDGCD